MRPHLGVPRACRSHADLSRSGDAIGLIILTVTPAWPDPKIRRMKRREQF